MSVCVVSDSEIEGLYSVVDSDCTLTDELQRALWCPVITFGDEYFGESRIRYLYLRALRKFRESSLTASDIEVLLSLSQFYDPVVLLAAHFYLQMGDYTSVLGLTEELAEASKVDLLVMKGNAAIKLVCLYRS